VTGPHRNARDAAARQFAEARSFTGPSHTRPDCPVEARLLGLRVVLMTGAGGAPSPVRGAHRPGQQISVATGLGFRGGAAVWMAIMRLDVLVSAAVTLYAL
jgi:hypothetical protein